MEGIHNLTQRQIEILKALAEEYISTAEPVGSETLEKRHSISASPATIRNEMVKLTEMGYLQKPHSSAGRMPTPRGMKFYVNELMKEKDISVGEEVAMKEKVWDLSLIHILSSLSEHMTQLLSDLRSPVDTDIAQNLLDGIINATDSFKSSKTTYLAFEMAGILMRQGAIRRNISRCLLYTSRCV